MDLVPITEGGTGLLVPVQDPGSGFPPGSSPVFFNRRMALSRDATVLLLLGILPGRYLDAMGATGARGIRVAKECGIPVTINDRDPLAVELIRKNASHAEVPAEVTQCDVNVLLSSRRFDAVDLDPFGTPAPFVDAAARSAMKFLFVTATDTAPLCGAHGPAGARRYFAHPVNNEYHGETGLRTLLGFVVRELVKYDRGLEPLLCFSREHAVRLHVRVRPGARAADRTLARMGFILQCDRCFHREEEAGLLPSCRGQCSCGGGLVPVGPLWLGGINDTETLSGMLGRLPSVPLAAGEELFRLLSVLQEELPTSSHYDYHRMAKALRRSPPPIVDVLQRIRDSGYPASRAHYSGTAIKTEAPVSVIGQAIGGTRK
ncbi:MAG TPA: tRNA (guanine(26)-N(2))-dimethyltransferase [Methanomicrobiales archaeon]|nr:tRNA (guanine(26)-N(2))-dimethyltransferase [Methanomicrobiales archaeon]